MTPEPFKLDLDEIERDRRWCRHCEGRGFYSRSVHARGCDGHCRKCPVEEQVQCQCEPDPTIVALIAAARERDAYKAAAQAEAEGGNEARQANVELERERDALRAEVELLRNFASEMRTERNWEQMQNRSTAPFDLPLRKLDAALDALRKT